MQNIKQGGMCSSCRACQANANNTATCLQALSESIRASVAKEQDEKVAAVEAQLKRMIQKVATAPVTVNLSDDAKKEIVKNLEQRVSKLEGKG